MAKPTGPDRRSTRLGTAGRFRGPARPGTMTACSDPSAPARPSAGPARGVFAPPTSARSRHGVDGRRPGASAAEGRFSLLRRMRIRPRWRMTRGQRMGDQVRDETAACSSFSPSPSPPLRRRAGRTGRATRRPRAAPGPPTSSPGTTRSSPPPDRAPRDHAREARLLRAVGLPIARPRRCDLGHHRPPRRCREALLVRRPPAGRGRADRHRSPPVAARTAAAASRAAA